MKLENQVCTLKQGKRLKELGVNALSYFSWFGDENKHNLTDNKEGVTLNAWLYVASTEPINNQQVELRENTEQVNPLAPAYSDAELGVMLPEVYGDNNNIIISYRPNPDWVRGMNYPTGRWLCDWDMDSVPHGGAFCETEAEARAGMLIWLLENNLTTPEEVNQRLNNA